jgi:hypothetical protein
MAIAFVVSAMAFELTSAHDRDSVRSFGWKTFVARLLV